MPQPQPIHDRDGVQLYHGDSAEVLPALGVQADLIVTSPPYDNLRDYGGHEFDFRRVAPAIAQALTTGGVLCWHCNDMVVDGGYSGNSLRQALAFQELGLRMHDRLVVDINRQGALAAQRYYQTWDYCFVFSKGKPRVFNPIKDRKHKTPGFVKPWRDKTGRDADGSRNQIMRPSPKTPEYGKRTAYWYYGISGFSRARKYGSGDGDTLHHAIMPMPLARDLIRSYSDPGDLVLDPFSGSGTTARAAQLLRRRAIGIEIHRPYIDAAIEARFAQGVML